MEFKFAEIYEPYEVEMLQDAYAAVQACDAWGWLMLFQPHPNEGFMFSADPMLTQISLAMKHGHSGASFALTMRILHDIARQGWESHTKSVIRRKGPACPCRGANGYLAGWCGVAGGGVPACDH